MHRPPTSPHPQPVLTYIALGGYCPLMTDNASVTLAARQSLFF